MKRFIALLLAVSLCLSLWACGSEPEVRTQPTTEATTEPIPDITIRVMVPEDWSEPNCAVWQEGSADAVGDSMQSTRNGWYFLKVPGLVTGVRVGGIGGTVTTGDLEIEAGKDVWIHVVNENYAFVRYEEPSQEQLEADAERPARDYSASFANVFFPGDYQITGTKAVAYDAFKNWICADYVPEELLAEDPHDVYYIIKIIADNETQGYYMGGGGVKLAVQLGVIISIEELTTGKVLAVSDTFYGGLPPETIQTGDSGTGTPPDAGTVKEWIRSAFAEIMESAPEALPTVPGERKSLQETAVEEAENYVNKAYCSREELVAHLFDRELCRYSQFSVEDVAYAVENCGMDWMEVALLRAKDTLEQQPQKTSHRNPYLSHAGMIEDLMSYGFTEAQALYAADNCGADWKEQAVLYGDYLMQQSYTRQKMLDRLEQEGFTKEEAEYAADYYGLK